MKPFIIYTYPFSFGIGGVVVLHKLCDLLNSLGQKAYIFPEPFPGQTEPFFLLNESYNTPIITQEILSDINNCIVIYPEVIRGNPLNAKNIVRYLLAKPFSFGNDFSPLATDYIATYSQMVLDKKILDQFYFLNNEPEYFKNIDMIPDNTNDCVYLIVNFEQLTY